MENSFKTIIDRAKSILILLPIKPYFDQVASGLALYLALREDKQVQISCPMSMTVEFNSLIGVNKITQELGNKNMVIRFSDYKASDIERVSYDIENGQFRLTVIPKSNINPPTKEQVELSYSGISADTTILIGGANESHFPILSSKDMVGASVVHIGIKDIPLTLKKEYLSFARPSSSVSEVTYSLLKQSGIKVDQDIATNLLMGIEEGSSSLTNNYVTAETFLAISELMRLGGKRTSPGVPQIKSFPSQVAFQPEPAPIAVNTQEASSFGPAQYNNQKVSTSQTGDITEEKAPKDWLEPKIFKGTSAS